MKQLLRIEHAALAAAALYAYHLSGGGWWLFLLLVLVPDLSMLGYLAGPRVGAWCYNAVHSWLAPVLLYLLGIAAGQPLMAQIALVLAAHIAIDRALGYGLKRESGFKDTHLGRIGG
ncbi:DUF4260 domain-containing protein [Chelativorans intermedius]|uniref:DUF4260 domain-containing protein n=1 Tax=Chelativorans intermedius TaxID=515947 RepID=A0ABV6D7F1_9HYPH|nr:DUF4260 domain-containing protein [Chelativorans intermedius]MCT8999245.1 DUF4260 domain-containing protein [Chelativorans intermedius]